MGACTPLPEVCHCISAQASQQSSYRVARRCGGTAWRSCALPAPCGQALAIDSSLSTVPLLPTPWLPTVQAVCAGSGHRLLHARGQVWVRGPGQQALCLFGEAAKRRFCSPPADGHGCAAHTRVGYSVAHMPRVACFACHITARGNNSRMHRVCAGFARQPAPAAPSPASLHACTTCPVSTMLWLLQRGATTACRTRALLCACRPAPPHPRAV